MRLSFLLLSLRVPYFHHAVSTEVLIIANQWIVNAYSFYAHVNHVGSGSRAPKVKHI